MEGLKFCSDIPKKYAKVTQLLIVSITQRILKIVAAYPENSGGLYVDIHL